MVRGSGVPWLELVLADEVEFQSKYRSDLYISLEGVSRFYSSTIVFKKCRSFELFYEFLGAEWALM